MPETEIRTETAVTADILDFLTGRKSVKAQLLGDPAPDDEELEALLTAAMSAPDHGAIRPWRFLSIRGDARNRLADLFEKALKLREPEADDDAVAKFRSKPLRSPLIVAVVAEITENHPKVPPVEQVVATSCAVQHLLLACEASGYGVVLLTGWPAFDDTVRAGLGFSEKDVTVGFVYIGTPTEPVRKKVRPEASKYLSSWTKPV